MSSELFAALILGCLTLIRGGANVSDLSVRSSLFSWGLTAHGLTGTRSRCFTGLCRVRAEDIIGSWFGGVCGSDASNTARSIRGSCCCVSRTYVHGYLH